MNNPSQSLRVLSYNIHKGFNFGNRKFLLNEMRASIRELQPDLVCLQEVSGENIRHKKNLKEYPLESQFEYLADEVWPHFAYGKNAVYQHGHHGNAILSRFPIARWENIDMSTNRFEARGLLHAEISLPNQSKLHVLTTHLNLLEGGRTLQLAKMCEHLKKKLDPSDQVILAGDFNDWLETVGSRLKSELNFEEAFLKLEGKHPKTFPSFLPKLSLDRIYFRHLQLSEVSVLSGGHWKNLSDHLPLTALFKV